MASGYSQFCPIAKGSEIVAQKWTPLVLRELMCGARAFNDIHRGVPLMSRALLAERLRQLEADDVIERVPRAGGKGHDYRLTEAGEALRPVVDVIGRWGLVYGRQRINPGDRDGEVLMWALRRRVDRDALPDRRIVVCFELSGVARARTGRRLYWLILEQAGVDVCNKDPGFPVDVTITGPIASLIAVYLGYATWRAETAKALSIAGDPKIGARIEAWLRFDRLVGRDLPIVPPAARVPA
jgi:DNA-binding HxlR family transcriptional regulator